MTQYEIGGQYRGSTPEDPLYAEKRLPNTKFIACDNTTRVTVYTVVIGSDCLRDHVRGQTL